MSAIREPLGTHDWLRRSRNNAGQCHEKHKFRFRKPAEEMNVCQDHLHNRYSSQLTMSCETEVTPEVLVQVRAAIPFLPIAGADVGFSKRIFILETNEFEHSSVSRYAVCSTNITIPQLQYKSKCYKYGNLVCNSIYTIPQIHGFRVMKLAAIHRQRNTERLSKHKLDITN